MIECAKCETAQFLQITMSRVYLENGEIGHLKEEYHCTACGATGAYRDPEHGSPELKGDVQENGERPRAA